MGPASISTVFSGSAMRMASPWPTSINLMVTFALVCAAADGVPESGWDDAAESDWDGEPESGWDDAAEPCCGDPAGETTVGSGCVRATLK